MTDLTQADLEALSRGGRHREIAEAASAGLFDALQHADAKVRAHDAASPVSTADALHRLKTATEARQAAADSEVWGRAEVEAAHARGDHAAIVAKDAAGLIRYEND